MLADEVDSVIGVDTHRDTNTAQVVGAKTGAIGPHATTETSFPGYRRMLAFAEEHACGRRVWAIESTGSYGSGLTAYLQERGERVVEIDRPRRPARRNGAKSDEIDALRAAREALQRKYLAAPRGRGEREAIRLALRARDNAVRSRSMAICHLKSVLVSAPEGLRTSLRQTPGSELVARCSRLRGGASDSVDQRMTVRVLRLGARRILALEAEAAELEAELVELVGAICPALLAVKGVGAISAAELINAWSHSGRVRSEAAFAMLAGAAPIPASSGQTVRHRLNRSGDRQLNRALHTIALTRIKHDPETRAYAERRKEEGKTPREIKRCLKRYLARRLFRMMEAEAKMA
jgi:transposase